MDDNRAAIPDFRRAILARCAVIPAKAGIQKAANIAGRARERDTPAR